MTAAIAYEEEATGTLGPWQFDPSGREYQVKAVTMTAKALEDDGFKSVLVVMPTGTGKTLTAAIIARWVIEDLGGRVLFIAHTGELIEQARNDAALAGITAMVEQAGEHARPDFTSAKQAPSMFPHADTPDPKFVVGSVKTLQGPRLKKWPRGHFKLIIVDEGHHCVAPTYQNILDHFAPDFVVGFTATADRGDGQPVCGENQVFQHLAYEYHIHDAVREEWLARPRVKVLDTSIDLKALCPKGLNDLSDCDIEAALLPHVSEIVNELKDRLDGHRAVIFTPLVKSAEAVASAFCSIGVSAVAISGESENRSEIIAGFRDGRYQHIVNAMVLTEGWNAPWVDSVVILRPTRSRALYVQMAGRCLRKFSGKPESYIWGVNWQTHIHDLVHPVEIFNSPSLKINPETIAGAKELIDSGEELDIASALKRAQTERKERRRVKLEVEARKATAKEYTYDPLSMGPMDVQTTPVGEIAAFDPPATVRQVEALIKFGIDRASAHNWSKKRASGFIGSQCERRERGLSTYRQQQLLKRLGCPTATRLTFAEASAEIERLKSAS